MPLIWRASLSSWKISGAVDGKQLDVDLFEHHSSSAMLLLPTAKISRDGDCRLHTKGHVKSGGVEKL